MLKKFRGYDTDAESRSCGAVFDPENDRTIQSEKENSDINVIVRRFGVTGVVPQSLRPVMYGQFEGVFDFQSAMNAVREAQERFAELPAEVRKRFANNPQEFVVFCSNPENLPEMRKMGLAVPEAPPPEPVPAPAPQA